jgi:glycogen synthase kinase 3 beta
MGRIVGTKDIKKIRGSEQASKLLPNIKGFGLNEYLSKRTSTHLIDLLSKMLRVNPADRIEAVDVLVHPYFDELRDDQAYQEIMKEKFDISDFFDFSSSTHRFI